MIRLRSILYVGMLAPLAALPAAAEPRASLMIQAQAPVATPPQTSEEERDRRRNERRQRFEDRRDDRQRQPPQAQAPAAPPARGLPPVTLPTIAPPSQAQTPPAAQVPSATMPPAALPPGTTMVAPAPAAPRAATNDPNDRDRRSGDRRRRDAPPSQAQTAPAAPTPPAPAAPTPAAPVPSATMPPAATPPATTASPTPAPAAPQPRTTGTLQAPAAAPTDTKRADRRYDMNEWRNRRVGDIRDQRTQTREGNRTVIREPGRTIIRDGNRTTIQHDDSDRLRARARDVQVERRGRDTVTTVVRPDGTRIVTVVDERDRLLRRSRFDRSGREVVIIDNRSRAYFGPPPVVVLPPPRIMIPRERYILESARATPPIIFETLDAPPVEVIERPYALDEIRGSVRVRDRMARIDVDTVTFETGSWQIEPAQAAKLEDIAVAMKRIIDRNPAEVFLIEGHTDAVGPDIDNLSLSDRRAESVAVVLSEDFGVPPENLQTQGYGEQFLKVPTPGPSRENRRVAIRRITPLLSGTAQAIR